MSASSGFLILNTMNQLNRRRRYDYQDNDRNSRLNYREREEQRKANRAEREQESFKDNIQTYSKTVKDIVDKVNSGNLTDPEKTNTDLILGIRRATNHYTEAYGNNNRLTTSEILNKGLNSTDAPFTEKTFADVKDRLFIAAAQERFSEIEQDPTEVIGRLGWLNHFINEYKGENEELKALQTPYERLHFTPDSDYYYLHSEYNSNWETTLGITEDQYYNAALQAQESGISQFVSFFKEDKHRYGVTSAATLQSLNQYIFHTAQTMHQMDPDTSPEDYRQLILSEHGISDEHLSLWLKRGVVNDINNRLHSWNKNSFECENAENFNNAVGSNELAHTLMSQTANKIDLSILMENEDEIRAAGIDFAALKRFNTRYEQLELSGKYPSVANTLEWLGIRDTGCEALPETKVITEFSDFIKATAQPSAF